MKEMRADSEISRVMSEAETDLTATVSGVFAPDDWALILRRAQEQLVKNLEASPGVAIEEAWREVVRDFYGTHFWGFRPQNPKVVKSTQVPKPTNLGVRLIWITFQTMCVTKVIVLVLGQRYARSHENRDFWILMAVMFVIVANFGWFLWKNRHHQD